MSRAVQNGGSRGGDSGGQDLPERRRILQNQGEHMTGEEIIRIVEEEEVEFIRLQFTDLFGIFKNIAITASQLERALDGRCMFDGSSIEGFVRVEESDMYLHPDLNTFEILPWRPQQGKVARMICDVYMPDGTPFEGDPRYILRRAVEKAKKMENVRRDIILNMNDMGYEIEASHHEIAPSQHEIDFKYVDAMAAADMVMTFKMAAKIIGKRHGMHATFMPKPLEGENGSGMHINMSLSNKKGKNMFADPKDPNGLSKIAYQFMAGILFHIREILPLTNPLVNSYKRLMPGFEAPTSIAWSSQSNRSQLIRIPSTRGEETRIELRCPDSAANPYVAMAACLCAGLDGIEKKMTPPPSMRENLFDLSADEVRRLGIEALPETLGEALAFMEKSEFARMVLGNHAFGKYLLAKKEEWRKYRTSISSWEMEEYLFKV